MHLSVRLSGLIYGNSFAVALLPRKNKICQPLHNYFQKLAKTSLACVCVCVCACSRLCVCTAHVCRMGGQGMSKRWHSHPAN